MFFTPFHQAMTDIGVRDLVARGYSIPGRTSQKGGRSGACVPCRTLSDPVRGQAGWVGWGPVGSRQGTSGSHMVPSWFVFQSYTDTGQSSDPSGLVGSRRAISRSVGFPSETCFGTTGPVGARRMARLSRIDAQSMYGPPGHATASPLALRGPVGTQRTLGGPPAAPSDPL